jgi:Cof subfamily protein (haloacid dehalogenase superfamily)
VSPKLLALDVDGTLLRRDGTIHPEDTAAIARARAAGVVVTIATGRLYSGTRHVARAVGIQGPIACVDGSHIVDLAGDRTLLHAGIAGADAASVRDVVREHAPSCFLFANDSVIHDAGGAPFAGYVETWSPKIEVVADVLAHAAWDQVEGLMAVVAVAPEEGIAAAVKAIESRLGHAARVLSFPVLRIKKFAMLVRAAGPTKGTAVEWIARHHGLTLADAVVVGDWLNDVPMFQAAGRSFCMGQAPPAVKATATDQLEADGFSGGGVAEAVRRAFGI